MSKSFKIGDKVKNTFEYKNESCEVVFVGDINSLRYQIKYLDVYTYQGTNMISWVDESDITLDLEYYRDNKLDDILDTNYCYYSDLPSPLAYISNGDDDEWDDFSDKEEDSEDSDYDNLDDY